MAVLELDLKSLWSLPQPEEHFLQLFEPVVFAMMENPVNMKNSSVKRCLSSLLTPLAKNYGRSYNITVTIVNDILCKHDHAVVPLAELMEQFVNDLDFPHIVGDVLREIGKIQPKNFARDTQAAKNISVFIAEVASRLPSVVLPSVPSLLALLDGDVLLPF